MAKPILYNGAGSPQSIYNESTVKHHRVGTRAQLSDGRVFYYTRNSGAAIVAGNLLMSELVSGDGDDLAVTASAAGQKVVNVTPTGSKVWTDGDLQGGYLCVNDAVGEGITYQIESHPTNTGGTAFNITLRDDIAVALTTASQVTILKNPWMDAVIAAADQAHMPAGVANVAVTAGTGTKQYFWCQTWGVVAGWDDAATAIGAGLTSGSTAGQFEIVAATDASIGIQLFTGVATEYYPKFLRIAP